MVRAGVSAVAAVLEALKALGFRVQKEPAEKGGQRADLLARRGSASYAVEIKVQSPFRRPQLEGAVAHAILSLRDQKAHGSREKPLLAVWVERARPNAAAVFEAYVKRHAPGFDWLIVDGDGWRRWKIGADRGEAVNADREREQPLQRETIRSNLFAPRHQWMLKLLLLPGLDRKYWGGPAVRAGSVSALAEAAGAAKSHAWNLVALLERRGYLRREAGRFQFPGLRRLLDDWCAHVRLRPDKVIRAVPVYPERSADKALSRVLSSLIRRDRAVAEPSPADVVVGGHRACEILGLGRSNVRALRLYADDPGAALKRLDLVPSENEALLEIAQPKARESVFRACSVVAGLSVADALQLYLDLRASPARGVEQSDHVFDRVLAPHFKAVGWL